MNNIHHGGMEVKNKGTQIWELDNKEAAKVSEVHTGLIKIYFIAEYLKRQRSSLKAWKSYLCHPHICNIDVEERNQFKFRQFMTSLIQAGSNLIQAIEDVEKSMQEMYDSLKELSTVIDEVKFYSRRIFDTAWELFTELFMKQLNLPDLVSIRIEALVVLVKLASTEAKQALDVATLAKTNAYEHVYQQMTTLTAPTPTPSQPVAKLSVITAIGLIAREIFDNIKEAAKQVFNKVKTVFSKTATTKPATPISEDEEKMKKAKIEGNHTACNTKIKEEAKLRAELLSMITGLGVYGLCASVGAVIGFLFIPIPGGTAIGLAIGTVAGSGLRKIVARWVTHKFTIWYAKPRLMELRRNTAKSLGEKEAMADLRAQQEGELYECAEKTKHIGILDGGFANLIIVATLESLANLSLQFATGGLASIGETVLIIVELLISIVSTAIGDAAEKYISCLKAIKECKNLEAKAIESSLTLQKAQEN
jgi:hypothetical protein